MAKLIIEICPLEPHAIACLMSGAKLSDNPEMASDLADCARSGDCEPACQYIIDHVGVEFRIVARNSRGKYVNRLATAAEKEATARAIYFESDSEFSDERTAETYLVWEAAHNEMDR